MLTSVIEGFETRFGDGSNVCEVDCEGVMAYVNESWYMYMRHFTYTSVLAHLNESWHIYMSRHAYE